MNNTTMAKEIETDPTVAALDVDNENYDSEEDSDFQLDEADVAGDDSGLSSEDEDEDEADNTRPTKKRKLDAAHKGPKKRKAVDDEMELDSGDEATILKAKSKKKKKAAEDGDEEDFDIELSEGEGGGFVKTRAMRMKM